MYSWQSCQSCLGPVLQCTFLFPQLQHLAKIVCRRKLIFRGARLKDYRVIGGHQSGVAWRCVSVLLINKKDRRQFVVHRISVTVLP